METNRKLLTKTHEEMLYMEQLLVSRTLYSTESKACFSINDAQSLTAVCLRLFKQFSYSKESTFKMSHPS